MLRGVPEGRAAPLVVDVHGDTPIPQELLQEERASPAGGAVHRRPVVVEGLLYARAARAAHQLEYGDFIVDDVLHQVGVVLLYALTELGRDLSDTQHDEG